MSEDSSPAVSVEEESESSKNSERLTAMGTMIAAIAAAIGLIFSGATTLYSVLVSQDQLQASRDSNEKDKIAQAERVNAWSDSDLIDKKNWSKFTQFIYIENRSADTVYAPVVYFDYIETLKNDTRGERWKQKTMVFAVGRFLPACTRIKIKSELVLQRYYIPGDGKGTENAMPAYGGVGINFYDTSGVAWDRFSGDRNSPPRIKEVKKIRKVTNPFYAVWYLEELRQMGVVSKAENCSVS